jgi:phospholipase C
MPRRREFLRLAAALAATGPALLPEAIRKARAIPAANATGTIRDVRHVVILMQENRSFDHYFGTFPGVRGFGDPRPVPLHRQRADGTVAVDPVWRQPHAQHPDGFVLPYPLHPRPVAPAHCFSGLPHGWKDGQEALNRGRNDGWSAAKSPQTMAYYQGADIPFHFALADAFTICDAYHCSLVGPTHPNRQFLWSGTNGQARPGFEPRVGNLEKRYQFEWTTYPERLQAAGISWQVYQNSLLNNGKDLFGATNAGLNALQWFKAYDHLANPDSPLVARGNAVRTLDDLRADVRAGKLPQVSWIIPPGGCCEHPQFPPAYGAAYMSQLLDALTADPEVWSGTVLLIMYDENDGFFDHVMPPMPPAAKGAGGRSTIDAADEIHPDGRAYGLGNRVPMTVVSPWSRGGWVCSQVFDHTSVIRFLEQRFGVMEPNISAWRRAVCGDLTSAFDFAQPNAGVRAPLPDTSGWIGSPPNVSTVKLPPVPATQAMPGQVPGTRPARPLPYQLAADISADAAQQRVAIALANHGSAAAVFQVYSADPAETPRFHTVGAGQALSDEWAIPAARQGAYELTVYGPNGFLRCFRGTLVDRPDAARPEVAVVHDAAHGALTLAFSNPGAACTLTLARNAYGEGAPRAIALAAGASISESWPLGPSRGWYDLSVTIAGDGRFVRRYAGYAETGAPGVTDPAMGAVIAAAPFDGRG